MYVGDSCKKMQDGLSIGDARNRLFCLTHRRARTELSVIDCAALTTVGAGRIEDSNDSQNLSEKSRIAAGQDRRPPLGYIDVPQPLRADKPDGPYRANDRVRPSV
jgi:hypothetical protein